MTPYPWIEVDEPAVTGGIRVTVTLNLDPTAQASRYFEVFDLLEKSFFGPAGVARRNCTVFREK